jgi:acetyltransferase
VELGPYLFLGAGGLMGRASADEAVVLAPLNRLLARRLVEKSRLAQRLSLPPAASDGLEEVLVRLSQLVVDLPEVAEIEMTSLAVTDDGLLVRASRAALRDRGITSPAHLVTAPYPNQYESAERLRDGTEVLVRPIKPEDAPAHYDFIRGLSSRTIYNRFFGFRKYISDEQMVRFTQIDYDREIAIVARLGRGSDEVTIGVNRLVYDPHTGKHEFAVVVADAWQGSGVGAILMRRLIDIARDRKVKAIYGMVLADNGPMLALARKCGFVVEDHEEDALLIRLDLG